MGTNHSMRTKNKAISESINKKTLLFFASLILFSFLSGCAGVQRLDSFFANQEYIQHAKIIDFAIFFVLFFSLSYLGFSRVWGEGFGKPGSAKNVVVGLSLTLGLALSFALVTQTQFSIMTIFPLAKAMLFLIITFLLGGLIIHSKVFGEGKLAKFIAIVIALIGTYLIFSIGTHMICQVSNNMDDPACQSDFFNAFFNIGGRLFEGVWGGGAGGGSRARGVVPGAASTAAQTGGEAGAGMGADSSGVVQGGPVTAAGEADSGIGGGAVTPSPATTPQSTVVERSRERLASLPLWLVLLIAALLASLLGLLGKKAITGYKNWKNKNQLPLQKIYDRKEQFVKKLNDIKRAKDEIRHCEIQGKVHDLRDETDASNKAKAFVGSINKTIQDDKEAIKKQASWLRNRIDRRLKEKNWGSMYVLAKRYGADFRRLKEDAKAFNVHNIDQIKRILDKLKDKKTGGDKKKFKKWANSKYVTQPNFASKEDEFNSGVEEVVVEMLGKQGAVKELHEFFVKQAELKKVVIDFYKREELVVKQIEKLNNSWKIAPRVMLNINRERAQVTAEVIENCKTLVAEIDKMFQFEEEIMNSKSTTMLFNITNKTGFYDKEIVQIERLKDLVFMEEKVIGEEWYPVIDSDENEMRKGMVKGHIHQKIVTRSKHVQHTK